MALARDRGDKEFGYGAPVLEIPFFDQFSADQTADANYQCRGVNAYEVLEGLADSGETTSNSSYHTDSTSTESSHRSFDVTSSSPQISCRSSLSRTAFQARNFASSSRPEQPQPVVSGLQLLQDVEGQSTPISAISSPLTLHSLTNPAHSLRRKPKFNALQARMLPVRGNQINRNTFKSTIDSSGMMHCAYHHNYEEAQAQECTQRFEQISLQSPTQFSTSTPSTSTYDEKPAPISSPSHNTNREQFLHEEKVDEQLVAPYTLNRSFEVTSSRPLKSLTVHQQPLERPVAGLSSTSPVLEQPARQSSSWAPSVNESSNFDCPVSPDLIHANWAQGSTQLYYGNVVASQSAPALAHSLPNVDLVPRTFPLDGYPPEYQSNIFHPTISHNISYEYPPPSSSLAPYHTGSASNAQPASSAARRTATRHRPSKSLTHHSRKSKSASNLKSTNGPKSSSSTSAPLTQTQFLNFTPSDSQKILTGVAPSGSSKTKARREMEASERNRKLSLAAMRLVERAGGDVEVLREQGLLIDGE
ncbi:MAG: hypothetical protein LQ351_005732 [Letrouitia transgressa]|nr:MAG: hypothetical protein LQ351_005732 [Letrouitia transgressa]